MTNADNSISLLPRSTNPVHLLPPELVGRSLNKLSVIDRLHCERVSPRWNQLVWSLGWTEQWKLDYHVVFDGTMGNMLQFLRRFRNTLNGANNVVFLFERLRRNVVKLDLSSFSWVNDLMGEPTPGAFSIVCPSLSLLSNLTVINIASRGLQLSAAVPYLPVTLREIHTSRYDQATLLTLAIRCPNLEAIDFDGGLASVISPACMNRFLNHYPFLKKLRINCITDGPLTAIGGLRELEDFEITKITEHRRYYFNSSTINTSIFEAMVERCKTLRRLAITPNLQLSEETFCKLAELSNLVELVLPKKHPSITDNVMIAISKCQKLKCLDVKASHELSDASIIAVIQNCQSLTKLTLSECWGMTVTSLEALVAELRRRHGVSTPIDIEDESQVFQLEFHKNGIFSKEVKKAIKEAHPWLRIEVIQSAFLIIVSVRNSVARTQLSLQFPSFL